MKKRTVSKINQSHSEDDPALGYVESIAEEFSLYLQVRIIDEYDMLTHSGWESHMSEAVKQSSFCTITRGLNDRGMNSYQLEFWDIDNCSIDQVSFEIPPSLMDMSYNIVLDWDENLRMGRVRFWHYLGCQESKYIGELPCLFIRADSIPIIYAFLEEAFEVAFNQGEDLCFPQYEEPIHYNFNHGTWHTLQATSKVIAPYKKDQNSIVQVVGGTPLSFQYRAKIESGQCFIHVRPKDNPDELYAVGGMTWDKKHQDSFYAYMLEQLVEYSDCDDWIDRDSLLNLDVVGRIPVIGTVYTEHLKPHLKNELGDLLEKQSMGIINHHCPIALKHT